MNNDRAHHCDQFTTSVAAEFDRLWVAIGHTNQRLRSRHDYQTRQDQLVTVQFDTVRDEIDDVADWVTDRYDGRLDAAVGEAALARIEIDRVQERLTELVDELNLRIAEVEALVASSTADVASAVQTERLDELERAIDELGVSGTVTLPPPPMGQVPCETGSQADALSDDVADSMARLMESINQSGPIGVRDRSAFADPSHSMEEVDG